MSEYKIETKCLQSGYVPGNGEPRVLPIYQSTTYKYDSSEHLAKLFDLTAPGKGEYLIPFAVWLDEEYLGSFANCQVHVI